ncbi:hypothetical protein [Mesorhizobium australicum]|uniref:hypothetical protein n=1 Tax=Mesorhizobium australicum TaxID=536018 RepID=UPI00333DF51C
MSNRKIIILAGLLMASPASAGQSLAELIQDDSTCRQYNDGCSICLVESGRAQCSTPSIACVKTRWFCVQHVTKVDGAALDNRHSIRNVPISK